MQKRIFIASSTKALNVAKAVKNELNRRKREDSLPWQLNGEEAVTNELNTEDHHDRAWLWGDRNKTGESILQRVTDDIAFADWVIIILTQDHRLGPPEGGGSAKFIPSGNVLMELGMSF